MEEFVEEEVFDLRTLDAALASATPLHLVSGSCSSHAYAMLHALLQNGADPNARMQDGLTPLHIAAQWGQYEALKLLLANGADPALRDNFNKDALMYANESCQYSCIRLLEWWLSNSGGSVSDGIRSGTKCHNSVSRSPASSQESNTLQSPEYASSSPRICKSYVPKYFTSPLKKRSDPRRPPLLFGNGKVKEGESALKPQRLNFDASGSDDGSLSSGAWIEQPSTSQRIERKSVEESFLSIVEDDRNFAERNSNILKLVKEEYTDEKIKDAAKAREKGPNTDKTANTPKRNTAKIDRILDIWRTGHGVVSLHVFHSIIPVEAYTREAAMIDALGLPNLTNACRGDYYGLPATWPIAKKRNLGIHLLHKALKTFLEEGERPLLPQDIAVPKN